MYILAFYKGCIINSYIANLFLLTAWRCRFCAASLKGGVLDLPVPPPWMERGNIVGTASGFSRFLTGIPASSR